MAEVIGIDVEEQLIDASRTLIAARGLSDNIRIILVEPGPFPFSDNSFDMVFTKDAMVHIPDKAALYREVWGCLVPGGHFIAADWLWAEAAIQSGGAKLAVQRASQVRFYNARRSKGCTATGGLSRHSSDRPTLSLASVEQGRN